jgi:hypothetical protein
MRVLVACEFSGVVRDAFSARGHDAWSCDLRDSERPGQHIRGDAREVVQRGSWDLLIAHPPCTHLASSGARWWARKRAQVQMPWGPGDPDSGLAFFRFFLDSSITRLCVENPVGLASRVTPPTQIIQPWQFGHGETKATCLWLRGLPPLKPTNVVDGRAARIHMMAPSLERERERSRTYAGIAQAMAEQWG